MQKVLTFPNAAAQQKPPASPPAEDSPAILERSGHTFIGSVLFADIVEYSKKPVAEQLQVKDRFNGWLSEALADIAPADRIILDTGDGAAVNFLGDPEDALFVAMNLAGRLDGTGSDAAFQVRIGINLGPVRLMRDINGLPNIIGDGINVAQRVMSFARPGQVLVSRSYHEVVTRLSQDYVALFSYLGSRTDKHVREHEVYVVSAPVAQVRELAERRQRQRPARARANAARPRGGWLRSPGLAWGFLSLAAAMLAGAAYFSLSEEAPVPAARPAVSPRMAAAPPRAAEPSPPALDPQPVAEEPVPSAPVEWPVTPAAKPADAAAKPEPARRMPVRSQGSGRMTEDGAQSAALSSASERLPEPALIKPEPKPEPVPDLRAEPSGPKPVTLPTQYRATAGPTSLVMLAISPWGEVLVDGKVVGVSPPMNELELSPGKHQIEVRNGPFKPYRTEVDLGPNETTRIKHKFRQGR